MRGRILVIEDNPQNLYLTRFMLEKSGYEVIDARGGREGITLAGEVEPALVLLDIQLPGMDGYEVARELRALPLLRGLPIVALTSYAMVGDRERILGSGCTGYIEKPIDPDTFIATIERFLQSDVREGVR
jgi:CheY-like chemotaxis protein